MQAFDTELRNRIIKLVKGILEQNSLSADVTPQAKLVDVGLTSMDMVRSEEHSLNSSHDELSRMPSSA